MLDAEDLLDLLHGVVRPRDSVTDGAAVLKYLVVITARAGFVPEEMNLVETFILHKLKAVGFIPALRETIY